MVYLYCTVGAAEVVAERTPDQLHSPDQMLHGRRQLLGVTHSLDTKASNTTRVTRACCKIMYKSSEAGGGWIFLTVAFSK